MPRLTWRTIARQPGGSILALATYGPTMLAGTPSGLFQRSGREAAWQRIDPSPFPASDFRFVQAVTLADWGDWYVATIKGLYRWNHEGGWLQCLQGSGIAAIRTVTIAQNRIVIVAHWQDGVLVSHDAGETWEPALAGLPAFAEIVDLALSPTFAENPIALLVTGQTVFVARSRRLVWRASPGPSGPFECGAIVQRGETAVLFVGGERGLYRSTDAGETWESIPLPAEGPCDVLTPDRSGARLLVASGTALYQTEDAGDHWTAFPPVPSPVTAVCFDSDGALICGTLQHGLFRWVPAHQRWTEWNDGLFGYLPVGLVVRPSCCWLADWSGRIERATSDERCVIASTLPVTLAAFTSGLRGPFLACSDRAAFRSLDGTHWEPVAIDQQEAELVGSLASANGERLVVLSRSPEARYRLVVSADGGADWRAIDLPATSAMLAADLAPDGSCLALVTSDGSASGMVLQLSRFDTDWRALVVPSASTALPVRCRWDRHSERLLLTSGAQAWIIRPTGDTLTIERTVSFPAPPSALAPIVDGWVVACEAHLWHCRIDGRLALLDPPCPNGPIALLATMPDAEPLIGYAATAEGTLWQVSSSAD